MARGERASASAHFDWLCTQKRPERSERAVSGNGSIMKERRPESSPTVITATLVIFGGVERLSNHGPTRTSGACSGLSPRRVGTLASRLAMWCRGHVSHANSSREEPRPLGKGGSRGEMSLITEAARQRISESTPSSLVGTGLIVPSVCGEHDTSTLKGVGVVGGVVGGVGGGGEGGEGGAWGEEDIS